MAYACDRCGKGVLIGRHVSRSKNRTRKISLPNLHPFKGVFNGKKGRWKLCTKCLRTVKKDQKELEKKKQVKTEKKSNFLKTKPVLKKTSVSKTA